MKISLREAEYPCRNCGRERPGSELDRRMWCAECRAVVVRRSAIVARLVSLGVAVALIYWILNLVGNSPRFLVAYAVMVVAAYFFLYKMTQRVAFEVIRAHGVRPPVTPEDEADDGEAG